MADEDVTTEEPTFDMESAVEEVGAGLGIGVGEPETPAQEELSLDTPADEPVVEDAPAAEVTAREAPRSWSKESHAVWAGLPDAAKDQIMLREEQIHKGIEQYREHSDFGKQMKEVVTPYMAAMQAQGIDAPKAVASLLNAHHRLSNGTQPERQAYLASLAKNYGLELPAAGTEQPPANPALDSVNERLARIEQERVHSKQQEADRKRAETSSQVSAFAEAKDEKGVLKNPYFDECSDQIVALIKIGLPLQEAYDQAVYANPVTRQKELARLQKESTAKDRENARLNALKAKQASSTNVRTRDTARAPTEPKGKLFGKEFDADMQATIEKVRSRTH